MVCRADSPILNSTSYPYVGVTLFHYGASSPQQNINVVDIDLGAPGIQFRVTPEVPGLPLNSSGTPYTVTREFTLDFMTNQGAQIAIDAHRYWPTADGPGTVDGSGTPVNLEGVVASNGSVYESFFNAWRAPPPPGISWPALNIGASNQVAVLYGDPTDPLGHTPLPQVDDSFGHESIVPTTALYNAVSGNYQVVSNGIPITTNRLFLANDLNPNPRTAIGFTTNNHLILVAVDGGGNPWYGMPVIDLGWFMATNLGVFNAINADGGGSTTLAMATPQPHLVNFPSTGPSGRAVGGNLAVFAVQAFAQIVNIAEGSIFTAPPEIDITAEGLDVAGIVTNVTFYAGGSFIGNVAGAPFTLPWHNPPGGTYGLVAVAMDNAGLNTTSAVVHITVTCGAQPSSPANVLASSGTYCAVVQVSWTASSGAISYNIYRDGALVGNAAASPYTDTPGDTGMHSYTVSALNGCGTSMPSAPAPGFAGSCSGDFSMTVSPLSQTVPNGSTANYSVQVAASGGFIGTVTFSVTGLPSGAICIFSPPTVVGNGSTVVAVSAPLGTYTVTVTGTSGSLVHQVTATLVVSNPDFSISVSPTSRTINSGKSTTYNAKYTPTLGFAGVITWTVNGLPIGATGNFTSSGTNTVLLTVNTTKSIRSGTYTLNIAATSGTLHHSAIVSLIVR